MGLCNDSDRATLHVSQAHQMRLISHLFTRFVIRCHDVDVHLGRGFAGFLTDLADFVTPGESRPGHSCNAWTKLLTESKERRVSSGAF